MFSQDGLPKCHVRGSCRRVSNGKPRLEREDFQAWNAIEVTGVVRADRVAKFQSTRADDQVGEGQIDPLGCLLAADARDDLSSDLCHGVDGDGGFQFVQKPWASSATVSAQMITGTSPTAARMCWITSGVVRLARSAATKTLESRTNPRRADATVHGGT